MKCYYCGEEMDVITEFDAEAKSFMRYECLTCGKTAPYAGDYVKKAVEIGELVERKQREYGDSWGKAGRILEILYPDGVRPEQYHTFLGIVRVLDKICRLANGNQGEENAWEDLAGYGLLGAVGGEKNVSPDLPEVRKGSGDGDEGGEV